MNSSKRIVDPLFVFITTKGYRHAPPCLHLTLDSHINVSSCSTFVQGHELEAWKGARMPRINDLAITTDGSHMVKTFSY